MDYSLNITKEFKKIKEIGHSRYIYQNKLGKACFQHDMAYGNVKNGKMRWAADKVLCNKAFNFAKNPKYVEYQHRFASVVYKFLEK